MLISFKLMTLEEVMKNLMSDFTSYCKESLVDENNESLDISLASRSTR